jgi:hypothetical protein
MVGLKHRVFVVVVASAMALLPMAPAMAGGHGFRPYHPFGFGRGVVGVAVALATLPLVIASNVVAGVSEAVAPYPMQRYGGGGYSYAPPVSYTGPQLYATPRAGYYAGSRPYYGGRSYYAPQAGYHGHGYYRSRGNPYSQR